jgi:hypothetical protein
MEIQNLIDKEMLGKLPPIFQSLKTISTGDTSNVQKRQQSRFIKISFYQTNAFVPYSHYKSISKIFIDNESE